MSEHAGDNLMERRISAAMVEPLGGHAGAHYYDFGLARGLLAAGCRVSLYTCDETADPAIPGLRFYPFYCNIFGRGSRYLRALNYIRGTVVTLRKMVGSGEKIFHFQVFNDLVPELIVITLAKLFGRKVVLTVHDVSSLAGPVSWRRNATGWAYRLADQVIVHNRISRLELEGLGFPSAKISVLPHGHYLDSMREMPPGADARRALEIDPTAKVVLFFGQIRDAKGLDLLIQALPEIAREVPEVVLLIAGYYAAADVVALPYRRIYQSGVLMMAMTYGRSVIVSDLPGMTEVITDGVNGYVFSQGSKDELAKTVIRALQDGAERERVSLRASAYIREHHDWTRIGHQTAELYEAVLAGSALP
jgi:glycosyltransferase involved in cell wall biosynthesis